MQAEHLIIEESKISGITWLKYLSLGCGGWCLWVLIWLPFLAELARKMMAFGLYHLIGPAHSTPVSDYPPLDELGLPLMKYALVILCIGFLILFWSAYHIVRFRGRERRCAIPAVTPNRIAQHYRLDPVELIQWQQAKILTLDLDENGTVRQVSGVS